MRRSERPQRALGKAVRELRRKSGATQETVARDAGVTIATLSQIERGEGNPTWDTVTGIGAALGVSMAQLAAAADHVEKE
jgi:transcriptional regulator with XRE-family HTH domain